LIAAIAIPGRLAWTHSNGVTRGARTV